MTRPSHLGKLDAEGLREAAHYVEDQREALGLAAGCSLVLVVLLVFGRFFVLAFAALIVGHFAVRALQRPQKKRGEPRVLLDGTCGAVARPSLGGTEHLGEGAPAHDLPHLLQILGQADLPPIGGLDLGVTAEDFERWPDAGEDEVGAAHAFALQALHPVADALGQLAQHLGPVADRCIVRARTANEVNASGERGGLAGTQTRLHLGCDGPGAGDGPAAADHAGKECLPPLGSLVSKNDGAYAVLTK